MKLSTEITKMYKSLVNDNISYDYIVYNEFVVKIQPQSNYFKVKPKPKIVLHKIDLGFVTTTFRFYTTTCEQISILMPSKT